MEKISKEKKKKTAKIAVFMVFLAFFAFVIFVMATNSGKPDRITLGNLDSQVKGDAFILKNQAIIQQMYMNWLPNDIFWPTALLDNIPHFQIGELEVVRYNIRVLRDNLSRMRTTDRLDPSAEAAFTALSNDPYKWWLPSAESKWKKAYKDLEIFHKDLLTGEAHFYPRADNLAELLGQYTSLMGGVNTRLINAPHDLNKVVTEDAKANSKASEMIDTDIPWYRIDDNFYYAQGVAHALLESFEAIRIDFIDVLTDKNSVILLDKIVENLRRCDFEPLIVFNGDPGNIFANHSLNLSGIFNDARQKVNSLIVALKQG